MFEQNQDMLQTICTIFILFYASEADYKEPNVDQEPEPERQSIINFSPTFGRL